MKKLLLAVLFLVGSTAASFATCASPAVMKDNASSLFNMSLGTNAGDGNCASLIGILGTVSTTAPSYSNGNISPFSLTTAGDVRTVFSNTTIGVTQATAASLNATVVGTGTFAVQAAQSGTWNVTNAGTFAVQSAPSSAAVWGINTIGSTTSGQSGELSLGATTTAAPTYTTAQSNPLSLTIAGDLRTVFSNTTIAVTQGTASNLNATVAPSAASTWGINTLGSTTSGQSGQLMLGAVTTGAPTYTTAQSNALSLDTAGNLRVNVITGATSGAVAQGSTTSGQTGIMVQCAATTASPTYTTATTNPLNCDTAGNIRVNVATAVGTAAGATTSGITGSPIMAAVTTAAPSYTTAQTNFLSLTTAGALRIDTSSLAGTTVATGNGVSGAGTQRVNIASDNSTFGVQPVGAASGGLSTLNFISAANTTGVNVKNSAGTVYHVETYNNTGTIFYLKLYNASTAPTCGSGTPLRRIMVPASTSGAGQVSDISLGVAFGTGIGYCLTAGIADNDTTNPTAAGALVSIDFK